MAARGIKRTSSGENKDHGKKKARPSPFSEEGEIEEDTELLELADRCDIKAVLKSKRDPQKTVNLLIKTGRVAVAAILAREDLHYFDSFFVGLAARSEAWARARVEKLIGRYSKTNLEYLIEQTFIKGKNPDFILEYLDHLDPYTVIRLIIEKITNLSTKSYSSFYSILDWLNNTFKYYPLFVKKILQLIIVRPELIIGYCDSTDQRCSRIVRLLLSQKELNYRLIHDLLKNKSDYMILFDEYMILFDE